MTTLRKSVQTILLVAAFFGSIMLLAALHISTQALLVWFWSVVVVLATVQLLMAAIYLPRVRTWREWKLSERVWSVAPGVLAVFTVWYGRLIAHNPALNPMVLGMVLVFETALCIGFVRGLIGAWTDWTAWYARLWRRASRRRVIACNGERDIPSPDRIMSLVTRDKGVALRFPSRSAAVKDDADLNRIADGLEDQLPGLSVSIYREPNGRWTWITARKLISAEQTLANAEAILEAAGRFREAATTMMDRLLESLKVDAADVRKWTPSHVSSPEASGWLDEDWGYGFRTESCCFTHRLTGETVEVMLEYAPDFGVLNPWFFYRFLETTRDLVDLVDLFPDENTDVKQAFEHLCHAGMLTRLFSSREPGLRNAYVLRSSSAPGL